MLSGAVMNFVLGFFHTQDKKTKQQAAEKERLELEAKRTL